MKIHKNLNSKAVKSAGYDRAKKELFIEFTSDHSYKFKNVSKHTWTKMRKAESLGKFMHSNILGKYESLQLSHE